MRGLISMVNNNHVSNNLKVCLDSIVNNRPNQMNHVTRKGIFQTYANIKDPDSAVKT